MEPPRAYDATATLGFGCWLVLAALVGTGVLSLDGPATATLGFALAVLVVVPLVGRLADLPFRTGRRSRWYRAAGWSLLPAALAAVVALSLPTGSVAVLLAIPWLAATGVMAVFALQRGFPTSSRPPELALSVALVYLPVTGVALLAHRAGVTFGFGPTTMLLTAVHFSYAGCALPAFVGLLGREFGESRPYYALLVPVLAGPGIIGLGIAFSPLVELAAAGLFAVVVAALAVYTILVIGSPRRLGDGLVGIAALSVAVSMGAVVAYLASRSTAATLVDFETMLMGHGWLNAAGFGLLGLVGWRLLDPEPVTPRLGMPISQITARWRVGADFLDRNDLVADGDATGMVDAFAAFDGPTCESTRIDPAVRSFYERTAEYDLRIDQRWERGFRLPARVYAGLCRRVEQMNFPVEEGDASRLSSRTVSVNDDADGREDVRAWVRTYDDTGEAIYVALYATHRSNGRPYMNIAFPLPLTNLTSVLAVDPLGVAEPDGVVLSTRADAEAGIYVRTPLGPLRLPMDETIRVWSAATDDAPPAGLDSDGADLYARHEMFLFGRRFLQLDYRIDALEEGPEAAAGAVSAE